MAQLYYSPSFSLPSSVTDQLTWNGTAQASVTFNTSGDSFSDLLVMDLQSTAAVTASGAYPWSIDQPDQLFARQDAAVQYWYLIDYQGSVRDVLDNSGNVNERKKGDAARFIN